MVQANSEQLFQRLRRMSAGDISVLRASLETSNSEMTTMPGSANDSLWSEMVTLGWMSKRTDAVGPIQILLFKVEPAGTEPIRALLQQLARDQAHVEEMVTIANNLYDKVIPEIFQSLKARDIPWEDCMTILGGLVSETVSRIFKKEVQEEVLSAITQVAKHRISGQRISGT